MTDPGGPAQWTGVKERSSDTASAVPAEFQKLYRAELPYVFHSLRRMGIADADLEDVSHDVFLAVYRRWADFDRSRPVRPWLFGFAYRIASDHRRLSRHRHEVGGVAADPIDERHLPDEQLAAEQKRRAVLAALDAIALDRRSVLVMHDLDGHPIPEIARALAIPLNTAYSRLRLARRDFESIIRRTTPPREAP